jgi:rubrerythrin
VSQLSEKELTVLNELLKEEEVLIKKFKVLAERSRDEDVKSKFIAISDEHREHFKSLFSQLR